MVFMAGMGMLEGVRKGALASAELYCSLDEVSGRRAMTRRFGEGMCRPVIAKLHNLRLDGSHTYQVAAEGISVLMHSCGGSVRPTYPGARVIRRTPARRSPPNRDSGGLVRS